MIKSAILDISEVIGRNLCGDGAVHLRANNTKHTSVIRDCYRVRDVFKMKTFHTTTVAKDTCTTDRPLCQRTEFYLLLTDLEIKRNVNKLKTRKYSNKWTAGEKIWEDQRSVCSALVVTQKPDSLYDTIC